MDFSEYKYLVDAKIKKRRDSGMKPEEGFVILSTEKTGEMTVKEAIDIILRSVVHSVKSRENLSEALFLMEKAMERQIPKKPKIYNITEDCFDYECPECHMTYGRATWETNFCPRCGQAFGWKGLKQ